MTEPGATAGPEPGHREFAYEPPRRTVRWWDAANTAAVVAILAALLVLFPPVPQLVGLGWEARLLAVAALCGGAVLIASLAPEVRGKRIRLDGEAVTVVLDGDREYVLPWATITEVRVRRGCVRIRRTLVERLAYLFSNHDRSPKDTSPLPVGDYEIGRLEWIRPDPEEFLAAVEEYGGGRLRR